MVKYYAVRHKDRNILKKSRSGGFLLLFLISFLKEME